MNGTKRNRKRLRQRQRVSLLAMILSATATSVVAESRINPYFPQADNRDDPTVTAADRQQDVAPFERVDFGQLNRFVAPVGPAKISESNHIVTSTKPVDPSTELADPPKRAPRRLPRVGKRLESVSAAPAPKAQAVIAEHPRESETIAKLQRDSALGVPAIHPPSTRSLPPASPPVPDVVFNDEDARKIAAAARRQAILSSFSQTPPAPAAGRWLQSVTTDSCIDRAAEHLDDAYREYSVGAWASAEASAWKSLELVATGIDISRRGNSASSETPAIGVNAEAGEALQIARTAIGEACEFVASGAAVDGGLLRGIASSHQTTVLSAGVPAGMNATEAVDRYLDHARLHLAPLATASVKAAQAMDLLAAIQLGRDEAKWIPEETSLCLRRAALQGQPSNASLASRLGMQLAAMGLDDEADGMLRHALSLKPSDDVARTLASVMQRRGDHVGAQRLTAQIATGAAGRSGANRTPDVVQLSPAQFASISPPLNVTAVAPTARQSSPTAAASATAASATAAFATAARSAAQSPVATTAPATADPTPATRKRGSRFIPASLAGFRLPFSQPQTVTPPSLQSDPALTIVPAVDSGETNLQHNGIDDVETFRTYADSVNEQATTASSPIKRFFNKVPKLW